MPERHDYQIRLLTGIGEAQCQNLGCGELAVYQALYRFQHEGDRRATQRTWNYCKRHGEGWARVKGVACPPAPVVTIQASIQEPVIHDHEPTWKLFRRRRGL